MVRRTTWFLLLVFGLLVGFAWLFQRYQTNKTKNVATATPTVTPLNLYALASTQLSEIKIVASGGGKIDLYRDPGTSDWAIVDIPVNQADTFQIESISKQLQSLQVEDTFTQTLPLDAIGLVSPAYTITMTTTDGTQMVTYIGSQNAIGNGYYARLDSGPVVLVAKVVMDDVLNLLKNPPLLPTATPEVTPAQTVGPTEQGSMVTPTP